LNSIKAGDVVVNLGENISYLDNTRLGLLSLKLIWKMGNEP